METHSPAVAKRLWNLLRVAFFMMRKGLISKRKLIMDMNLMMKRGKLMGKTLGKLMFHHHSKSVSPHGHGFGLHEYEFSCSNSPNPVFFHAKRRHNYYFPCINLSSVAEEPDESPGPVIMLPRIEYSPQIFYNSCNFTPEEKHSPMPSPFWVRISNYSSEDEGDGAIQEVDSKADEFIKRFYEQLRAQRQIALLEHQEMEYQEMLARGT